MTFFGTLYFLNDEISSFSCFCFGPATPATHTTVFRPVVRIDADWQEWTFPHLVDALRKWTTRNPKIIPRPEKGFKCENAYQANDKSYKHRDCVYCEKSGHKASDCKTVSDIEERRLTLSKKKLCFSCTGTKHRASECLSKRSCMKCKGKQLFLNL